MNLIGKQIDHKSWGQGTIREIAQGYIITTFEIGEKKLQFPDAFADLWIL